MIELKDLSKIYRTETIETTALNSINLHIPKGSYIAIKGPSGCGKSTLLNILGLMDRPSQGEVILDGKKAATLSEKERNRMRRSLIGFVFQKFNLISSLTVFENVELPLLYQKLNAASRKSKVEAMLKQLGLEARAKHFPHQLSGGQQQRVALARCVINDPELILADEPTGNLDSTNGEEVMRLLTELHKDGRTIVMVTHDDKYAGYAKTVINLSDGNIVG
ncbi:MAG: ABC transporter ATP-binding protein [Candidatus Cloacimonadaceae bacterium]|jgi:putative ABC transport system ATP-binding protein|nr:ABC transporter ATP-binding protein [Candidatus Cloacimonadota bacterium]MDY0126808.1 ABC transporter ATP-binding protein [Candidatus Cloacimonadaceae bacterium]MCB5254210.1 ABC transporter ATP-binding protein [Candidatus Cloacimonadota bacterium]MCK9177491.1 ABC transporter ATP-binding protein [Candidatus Cloacimonadota bacterium]MCK9243283.1 ABC transporter ATP-binding protein [Candidatus Cloacimonadota bacterium]